MSSTLKLSGVTIGRRGLVIQNTGSGTIVQDASGAVIDGDQTVIQWSVSNPRQSSPIWFYAFWVLLALVVAIWLKME